MSFAWHELRNRMVHSASSLKFQRGFDSIRSRQAALAPFRDPVALLTTLHLGPGNADQKNLILTALIEVAQGDGSTSDCALTILLLALWPGLDRIRRRSIWRRLGTADEVASDLLARTTEAVRSLDLGRVNRIAATVLRNIERDMIRARKREITHAESVSDIEPDSVPAELIGHQPTAEDAHLQGDLRKLIGADALLVIRVAIEGFSQLEAARELGLTEAAARKRYQRAMRRLRDALEQID